MQINITEIKEDIFEGVLQKQFEVTYVSDEGEKGSQLMVLSGDALQDPKAAFLDGYNRKPIQNFAPEPQTDLASVVQELNAKVEAQAAEIAALKGAN